ncbi:ribosomal protein S6 [Elusimicrobium posterum]|uniref:hypothetical protein n=1 Tax=Elusimicrobium posterum TaxID=3116653 RepID=UPI003C778388
MKKITIIAVLIFCHSVLSASITVYPKYIFLDEKNKSAKVFVINQAEQSFNYRIGLRKQAQQHSGAINANKESVNLLEDKIKFSPKYIRELAPKKQQVVRITAKDMQKLPDGDYAVYLTITNTEPAQELLPIKTDNPEIEIQIRVIPEVALPVIVRKGKVNTSGVIERVSFKSNILTFRLKRAASAMPNGILRGDISVWHGDNMAFIIKGKYLLPENNYLDMSISLQDYVAAQPKKFKKGEELKILVTEYTDMPGVDIKNIICEEKITL